MKKCLLIQSLGDPCDSILQPHLLGPSSVALLHFKRMSRQRSPSPSCFCLHWCLLGIVVPASLQRESVVRLTRRPWPLPPDMLYEPSAFATVSRMWLAGREASFFGGPAILCGQQASAQGVGLRPGYHRRRIPPRKAHHARTPAGRLRVRRHQPL